MRTSSRNNSAPCHAAYRSFLPTASGNSSKSDNAADKSASTITFIRQTFTNQIDKNTLGRIRNHGTDCVGFSADFYPHIGRNIFTPTDADGSLFLISTHKLIIGDKAVYDGGMAWHEFCYPIEKMAEKVRQIAANKEAFAIPEELKQAANAHRELKTEINKKEKK